MCKIIERYKKNGIFSMEYLTPKGQKKRIEFYHNGFKKQAPSNFAEIDNLSQPVTIYKFKPKELIVRMLQGKCEMCDIYTDKIKVHHVAALKDLNPNKEWEAKMIKRRRKSLVVCEKCFAIIQSDM